MQKLRVADLFVGLILKHAMTGAAKALGLFADEFLGSDFLVFALLAGVACKRRRVINHQQHFRVEMNILIELCLLATLWLAAPFVAASSSKQHSHL